MTFLADSVSTTLAFPWTHGRGPWTLASTSDALSLSDARKLENKLKRQGRGNGFHGLLSFVQEVTIQALFDLEDDLYHDRPTLRDSKMGASLTIA